MELNITKEILEELYKREMLPVIMVSLISSDNLTTADACRKSLKMLSEFKEVLPTTNIPEKDWKDFIEKGITICKRDLYHFLEADNDEYEYGHNVKIKHDIYID